ncbi:MAG: hypothetical protein M3Y68_12700 [Chloroflexota bacterium]|nr:hypothetical protein [Chloroflexota bacterium]
MSERLALAGRIRASLEDVKTAVDRAVTLAEKARRSGDDDYWDGVALNLHGFYSGVEHIFEDIARTVDGGLPSGPEWHTSLLRQMTVEMGNLRPAVLRTETRQSLDEYRGFRHIARNVYAFNLRPLRLNELILDISNCFSDLRRDLLAFADFLEKTS